MKIVIPKKAQHSINAYSIEDHRKLLICPARDEPKFVGIVQDLSKDEKILVDKYVIVSTEGCNEIIFDDLNSLVEYCIENDMFIGYFDTLRDMSDYYDRVYNCEI